MGTHWYKVEYRDGLKKVVRGKGRARNKADAIRRMAKKLGVRPSKKFTARWISD